MDLTDASAMTEASGLSNDIGSEAAPAFGTGETHTGPHEAPARTATGLIAEQLREIAKAAPLRSLAAAFVVGVLVARRR